MKVFFLAISIGAAHTVYGADQDVKNSASAQKTAERMRGQIASELTTLPHHSWAGEYYAGDGLGVITTLSVAVKAGFVFEWHGCLGLYDRNYGTVTWTNGRLHLSFAFENEREGFQGLANELIPISWGKRQYLIPADDMVGFCNRVNDGSEPRDDLHGFYLLRMGDEKKSVTGFPSIPKEFQAYLLTRPVVAQIVSVGAYKTEPGVVEWRFKEIPVLLNTGSKNGLRVGMELLITQPTNVFESVRITKVDENRSEGILNHDTAEQTGPKIGWRLSTRSPWSDSPKSK